MRKIALFFSCVAMLLCGACDLQPRILSLPDSVGDFISARYPALLADPDAQPEIYNSAATDYGVYASPELYGGADVDDYVLYANVNDYMMPAVAADVAPATDAVAVTATDAAVSDGLESAPDTVTADMVDDFLKVPMYGGARDTHYVTVASGDTLYAIGRRYGATSQEIAEMNNLSAPYALRVGQKIKVPGNGDIVVGAAPVQTAPRVVSDLPAPVNTTPTKVPVDRVTVGPGDTLYSISRKYSVPVNDLAVMNDLAAPFALRVGQTLRVPNLGDAAAATSSAPASRQTTVTVASTPASTVAAPKTNRTAAPDNASTARTTASAPANAAQSKAATPAKTVTTTAAPAKKISSDPKQKLPKISARSSSKFSWPVRGKILSEYGGKSGGLFNDGINIGAARGTTVRAAENGVVAYAGNEVKGMGNLIIIQHSGGWMTVYAHMDSMALRRGAKVSVGQKIGTVGATGKVSKPQLHFEIRKGTKAYNPMSYLKK